MADARRDDPKAEWTKFTITTLLAIVAFIIGLVEYSATSFYSARKPFLEMQANLCKSAAEAAARVATASDKDNWDKARNDFWMLYWGSLAIVEDVELFGGEPAEKKNKGDCLTEQRR
jgi:hypothetical protein